MICFMVVRNCLGHWFSDFRVYQDHLKDVLKETAETQVQNFWFSKSGMRGEFWRNLRIHISNKFQVPLTLLV